MDRCVYMADYAGLPVCYSFQYSETDKYFRNYIQKTEDDTEEQICISLTEEYIQKNRWLVSEDEKSDSYLEFQALMLATGNMLLEHQRALFHGVAILWKEKAWLLTAPSGTGKTTQMKHWRHILRNNMKVINGDKPLIFSDQDGTVYVCSSPWRGKERYGHFGISAPLGGIIMLKQSSENYIRRINSEDAVLSLFKSFISIPENADQILGQSKILDQMLRYAPVWKLENIGDEDSAALTIKALSEYSDDAGREESADCDMYHLI